MDNSTALRAMLNDAGRLYPEERLELVGLLGRVLAQEPIVSAAVALVEGLPEDLTKLQVTGGGPLVNGEVRNALVAFAGKVRK